MRKNNEWSKKVKYLVYYSNSYGTNINDIEQKCNRVVGITNNLQAMLETMFFGRYHLEIGKTLKVTKLL